MPDPDPSQTPSPANMPRDDELATLRKREQEARDRADLASRARDAFLSKLSHDLRNPLGAIAAATEVLGRIGGQQPDEVRARDVIRRQVQVLTRMVDDLLDASRVINGTVTISRAPVDLAEVAQRAIDTLSQSGRAGDHPFDVDLMPAIVDADRPRLEQVVMHLLTNAVKFSPPGGSVVIRVSADDEGAHLVVTDSGLGIAPAFLGRVFEPFVRDEREAVRRRAGFGIGLALVKRVVDAHGGRVHAASDGNDRGSRFEIHLPRSARRG